LLVTDKVTKIMLITSAKSS